MQRNILIATVWIYMVAFWGMVYPEFSFTRDSIVVVNEEGKKIRDFESDKEYMQLLEGDKGKIVVKSKLLLWLQDEEDVENE